MSENKSWSGLLWALALALVFGIIFGAVSKNPELFVKSEDKKPAELPPSTAPTKQPAPAAPAAKAVPAPAKPISNWSVHTGKSDIDDSPYVVLSAKSDERPLDQYGRVTWPTLYVRCQENTTSLIVSWGRYLGIDETSVTYRIDDKKAVTRQWSISTNYESVGLWRGGQSIPLIKQMLGSKQFLARVTPYGDNPLTVRFDTTGLDQHIGDVRKACNW